MNNLDLNFDTLINVISDAIAERVQQKINVTVPVQKEQSESEEFLTAKESCEFIKECYNTLQKRVNEGRIPKPIYRGTRPFFKKSDLIHYLNHG